MENKHKLSIALTIACLASISYILATKYRKHRKQKRRCYLKTEPKPQHSFKRILADNSYSQFKHLKLHDSAEGGETSSNLHPYKTEITALLDTPRLQFEFYKGEFDLKMGESYVLVETKSQLEELGAILSNEKVFAVDTEQHSLRSFLGFTGLIQISTQNEDYLVDTIVLHDDMGILRPVFANPEICKVFHGADNDVLWLQKDFHIYVVNLFDTAKACEVLSKPQKSLAYLLEKYCSVSTNKLLQREDWRQRPLPREMVEYARMDAHYLLYISDCLTKELIQLDSESEDCSTEKFHFVLEASRRSNITCLQLYSKEIETSPGKSAASSIISRHLNDQGNFSSDFASPKFQELVFRLCAWRDIMARLHDEGLRYVLSDRAIVALADNTPETEKDIYNTILEVDLLPSAVVCSHFEDFTYIFQDNIGKTEDLSRVILQRCLGESGTCPLSIYNYSLLSKSSLKMTNQVISKDNGFRNTRQSARKASRDLFVQKFSCKSAVYHNCRIYANDGRLLCYCDRRKLEWYISRDLAILVEENPPAIKLLFEPKGRPEDEDNDFYIQSKKNICVGCGEGKHYLRYRIIPSCYRMHFPEHLKSHRSHDIVLLCVDCHEIAHASAEKYKRKIAVEFGIPLFIRKVVDSSRQEQSGLLNTGPDLEEVGVNPLELRSAAMALLRHGPSMPPKRRDELIQIVKKYYGGREITEDDLEKALVRGMSPHEKRRRLKKKGLALKNHENGLVDDKEEDSSNNDEISLQIPKITEDINNPSLCLEEDSETNDLPVVEDSDPNSHSLSPSGSTSNFDEDTAPKLNSKFSLLGHGPHGKQVVDHLLKEYGEDGISQFCQRWRHVFVDTVHPRFLPAGWDVKHSGRRDFGEFSVYNPTKRVCADDQVLV